MSTPARVAAALAEPGERYVLTSHHNPDGDAIGSLLGLARAMHAAGQDVLLAHPDTPAVPLELAFLPTPGERIAAVLPEDLGERTLVALDCASEERMWREPVHRGARRLVNIDHHQDNPRFGDLHLVDPHASSTAEIVMRVITAAGWPLTPDVAVPLYVGLVTDTGRFGYANCGPATHRAAATLLEAGVEVASLSRLLYEDHPLARLRLLGRALGHARLLADGRLIVSVLSGDDYSEAGSDETEGIVEVMRGTHGVAVAALVREAGPRAAYRVSLRATPALNGLPAVDVAAIAHEEGGGGHHAAAGLSTGRPPEELIAWLEGRVRAALGLGAEAAG